MTEGTSEQLSYAKRFARKHGMTLQQAQALIMVIGDDLGKLTAAAERLRRRTG